MKKLLMLAALSLAACGKRTDAAFEKLADLKARMCACKDAACVAPILMEYDKSKLGEKSDDQLDQLADEMMACSEKIGGSAK